MVIEQDLSAIWERIVRLGQIRSQFVDAQGRQIESGIRMTAAGPEHYAIRLDTQEAVGARTLERPLAGSNFVLLLNPFRALKPKTETLGLGRQPDTSPNVEDCFFACQDPGHPLSVLRRSIQMIAFLRHHQWAAVHNALPVEKNGHFLWIPVSSHGVITVFPHWKQMLTPELLDDYLELALRSKGMMTFFNSMHAGGSVNHIHYHSVYRGGALPIEQAEVETRGGRLFLKDYAASGLVYPDGAAADTVWPDVERLQQLGYPLNLVHCGERTCLFARHVNEEVVEEFPSGVLAGMELAGRPITTELSFYDTADWGMIQTALRKSTLSTDELLAVLGRV